MPRSSRRISALRPAQPRRPAGDKSPSPPQNSSGVYWYYLSLSSPRLDACELTASQQRGQGFAVLGELKHGRLKPRGFPRACYPSQAACETADRPWALAASARCRLLPGAWQDLWHRSPRAGSAVGSVLLPGLPAAAQMELRLHLSPGVISPSSLAPPGPSGVGEGAVSERQAQGDERSLQSPKLPAPARNCPNSSPLLARGLCAAGHLPKGDCQHQCFVPSATFVTLMCHHQLPNVKKTRIASDRRDHCLP